MKKLILLTGKRGSGKTIFGEIAKQEGCEFFEMSSVVFSLMKEQGIPLNSRNTAEFAKALRRKEGEDAVAKRLLPSIDRSSSPCVIVSGVRSPQEVQLFRSLYPSILVEVRARDELRFARIKSRARPSDPKTLEEFLAREEAEASLGLLEVLNMADVVVENNANLEEFKGKVKRLLAVISC